MKSSFLNRKFSPRVVVLVGAVLVMTLFTAAFQKERPVSLSSKDFHAHLRGGSSNDLPTGVSDMFIGSGKCAGCHGIDNAVPPIANITIEGENVSPAENWRATMMALSARDPMWRAKVAHEVTINPGHANELVNKCTSCHAPMGRFEAEHDGIEYFTMDMLDQDTLALDGVSCMACHAQQIETIGQFFSGELHYNPDTIWGPVFNIPDTDFPMFASAMQSFVGVEPVPAAKFSKSETCAGCHTLATHTADLEGNLTGNSFIEQATYHEWLNSSYNNDITVHRECQGCHMPLMDEPIIVASGYSFLPPRNPFRQHWFVGANTFMLELMKNRISELGITANENHFDMVLNRTLNNIQNETAEIELIPGDVTGDTAKYAVKVTNKVGHKLPSGYPARRAYIEFVMIDEEGNEIFHSGKLTPGFEVQGQNADFEPHYDVITDDENEVQIYEMVMGDVNGNVTTVLERADQVLKDNRFVPLGFTVNHPSYDSMAVVGSALIDPNFNHVNGIEGSGTDEVHYHIPVSGINGNVTVTARLMYQSLPPKWNQEMFSVDHPVINAFEEMYWEEGPDPVEVVATQTNSTLVDVEEFANFFRTGPNPTVNGQVTVDAGKDIIKSISVYSGEGKLIEILKPNASRSRVLLPYAIGNYLLDVSTSRGRRVEKVMRR